MPKFTYLGPYDKFYPDGEGGPELKPGDPYTMSRERKDQLGVRYQWADKEGEVDVIDPTVGTAAQSVDPEPENK